MRLSSPLLAGTLIKRYKRFLADIMFSDGTMVTAHTPNSEAQLNRFRESFVLSESQASVFGRAMEIPGFCPFFCYHYKVRILLQQK